MSTNMQGHNHGGKSHLLLMLGIGTVVLVVLLGAGPSVGQALPYAILLACPLMMAGMMFMMLRGGSGHQQGNNAPNQRGHNDATEQGTHDAPEPWKDSPNIHPLSVPAVHDPTLSSPLLDLSVSALIQ